MSADLLREAAAKMRRDAESATPGRWKLWGMTVMADQDGTSNVDTAVEVAQTFYRDENGKPRTWDANHIAGMHPAVALAVADSLDDAANVLRESKGTPLELAMTAITNAQLAVARAYLGEDA